MLRRCTAAAVPVSRAASRRVRLQHIHSRHVRPASSTRRATPKLACRAVRAAHPVGTTAVRPCFPQHRLSVTAPALHSRRYTLSRRRRSGTLTGGGWDFDRWVRVTLAGGPARLSRPEVEKKRKDLSDRDTRRAVRRCRGGCRHTHFGHRGGNVPRPSALRYRHCTFRNLTVRQLSPDLYR